jgi:hypothetical protein
MQTIFLSTLLAISLVRTLNAQETTGSAAEQVKKEIINLETEKLPNILQKSSVAADWFNRIDADGIVHVRSDGTLVTKAQALAEIRSGEQKLRSNKQSGHQVHVYGDGGNGTTAVVSYFDFATVERSGSLNTHHGVVTDVFVKLDGSWRRVVHQVTPIAHTDSRPKP